MQKNQSRKIFRFIRKTGGRGMNLLIALLCIAIGVLIFLPIGTVLGSAINIDFFTGLLRSVGFHVRSFSTNGTGLYGWSDRLKEVLLTPENLRSFQNSAVTTLSAMVIRVSIGTIAAFALAVKKFKGKKVVLLLILGTMMIPQDVVLIPNYVTVSKMNLVNTYLGMISVNLVSAIHIFMLYQCFRSLGSSLRDAAYIDGCNDFRFMMKVCVPCSAPVIAALAIHSFLFQWNDYLWPLLMSSMPETQTLTVAMQHFPSSMLLAFSLIPPLMLFLLFQKTLVRGLTTGSVVG